MLVFPQLATGASALYPVIKRRIQRTVLNTLDDGHADVYSDVAGAYTMWEMRASELTLAEVDAIDALFQQATGRLTSFTFLDPTDNLLAQSGDLTKTVWVKDPLIALTAGVSDPVGTTLATRVTNSASVPAAVSQTLDIPGDFHYCFSAWLRTTSASNVTCSIAAGSSAVSQTFILTTQWQRLFVSGNPGAGSATSVMFSLQLVAGASIEVYGLQGEPQLAPSDYKSTGDRNGVYSKARFASDQLSITAQAKDVFDAVIQIVSSEI